MQSISPVYLAKARSAGARAKCLLGKGHFQVRYLFIDDFVFYFIAMLLVRIWDIASSKYILIMIKCFTTTVMPCLKHPGGMHM